MAEKSRRSSGKNQFILGALVGAAAAYFILNQRGPSNGGPIVRPVQPGTIPMLPAEQASLAELPPYMFRPRTKLYL